MSIYLDYAATTKMSDRALEEYLRVQRRYFGNPNGQHHISQNAKAVLEEKREIFAKAVGARVDGTIFTSSATEASNLAIKGLRTTRRVAVISAQEHSCVLSPASSSFEVEKVPGAVDGTIDLEALEKIVRDQATSVGLFALMAVNNETGVMQPLQEATEIVRRYAPQAKILIDAVQAVSYLDLSWLFSFGDMMVISPHKFHGPKGVGVLYLKDPKSVSAIIEGGAQEFEKRSGTQDVASIAASAAALIEARERVDESWAKTTIARDAFLKGLVDSGAEFRVNGDRTRAIPSIVNIYFPGVRNEEMIFLADYEGIAIAAGAACASGALKPSHVLLSMGMSKEEVRSSVRVSFDSESLVSEVKEAAVTLGKIAVKLGNPSAL
ncbi:cysteine desulfurase family protein [Ferrithrix thermotolerans]|uniref:cysteine desulfurase family protein n=1 Tax=Ferrithrix thermotolerans TaxID=209649 RepID=UPI001160487C|nr:aminotransferase class V-fold PLP-dependent enzyme [Ferrithrix thermotolerans]